MALTIKEAVSRAKNGDTEAQAYLYEQTYKKAYYVSLKYMQNEDDAYDIVHDAYIRAFERISQLEDDSKFESWLNTIVASTALNALKKKKPDLFTDIAGDEEYDVSERFEADYSEQPEVVMDQNETSRLVQEIIGELSDEQRACVTMYYMQEMSVKEISGILNVSDNTVKSRLNYARKNIEAKVKELEKKGTKLYAFAPIPFFLFLLHTEADACEYAAVEGMYSASSGASAGASASTTSGTATGATSAGMSLGAKIAIGIIFAVVVIGGAIGVGVAVYNNSDNAPSETNQTQQESAQQKDFGKYLASQKSLEGKEIVREVVTDGRVCAPNCVYPEGMLGYSIQDINNDGKDELVVLDLNSDGVVTISTKTIENNEIKDIGEQKTVKIDDLFTKMDFYTFKAGNDTYLLMTYTSNAGAFANGSELGIYCYKIDGNSMTPVVENREAIGSDTLDEDPDFLVSWTDNFNKVLGLQGKSLTSNEISGFVEENVINLEPLMDLNRIVSLNKDVMTPSEIAQSVMNAGNEWHIMSFDTEINKNNIQNRKTISSHLITK